MNSTDEANKRIQELEGQGFRIWNDHPGYTIIELNKQLAGFGLRIVTLEESWKLWYKIERITT